MAMTTGSVTPVSDAMEVDSTRRRTRGEGAGYPAARTTITGHADRPATDKETLPSIDAATAPLNIELLRELAKGFGRDAQAVMEELLPR